MITSSWFAHTFECMHSIRLFDDGENWTLSMPWDACVMHPVQGLIRAWNDVCGVHQVRKTQDQDVTLSQEYSLIFVSYKWWCSKSSARWARSLHVCTAYRKESPRERVVSPSCNARFSALRDWLLPSRLENKAPPSGSSWLLSHSRYICIDAYFIILLPHPCHKEKCLL